MVNRRSDSGAMLLCSEMHALIPCAAMGEDVDAHPGDDGKEICLLWRIFFHTGSMENMKWKMDWKIWCASRCCARVDCIMLFLIVLIQNQLGLCNSCHHGPQREETQFFWPCTATDSNEDDDVNINAEIPQNNLRGEHKSRGNRHNHYKEQLAGTLGWCNFSSFAEVR